MNNRVLSSFFPAVGFAILINISLFALLPQFVERNANKNDLDTIIPVNIIHLKRTKPSPPHEKKDELPEKKQPEEIIPTVRLRHSIPRKQEVKMDMPRLSFEINPMLTAGMSVSPPPKETPVFRPKGSYIQGEVDQMPIPIFKMKPIYPYRAKRLNVRGKVEVKFLVDKRGHVSNIKILKSKPAGIFNDSVRRAIPSWKFSPGKVRGHAVSTWVVTSIEFELEGK